MNRAFTSGWARRLAEWLGLAAVYCVAGRLALLLAIPPGYATAVWPAAGLALAGVLLLGYRVWPGIVLGSFFVNLWTALDSSSAAALLNSISLAASIGVGAALQAVTGAYLLRRFARYPNPLVEEKPVLGFVLLGGPVSCLVSSTLGVATLWVAGVVAPENCFFSWWTWWVGDAIGVILFAPLALIWSNRPRPLQLRRRLTVSLPLAFMFVLAVMVYVYASQREQAQIQRTFQTRTDEMTERVQTELAHKLEVSELRGQVQATVLTRESVEASLRQVRRPGIELVACHAAGTTAEPLDDNSTVALASSKKSGGLQRAVSFEVAGKPWCVVYRLTPEYLARNRSLQAWAVLTGTLAFTGLAGAFLLVLTGRTATIEELVVQRTEELARANDELARSNQELDDFAFIASHDLKEPLRGIHNYSQFLLDDCGALLPEDGRAKCETLMRLTQRMESLIEALLYFSRVGRDELAMAETDLQQVLAEVVDSLDIRLKETGVAVRIPQPLPTLYCDRVRVREVFYNLVTNAMKYNDKPGKWIEIGCRRHANGTAPATAKGAETNGHATSQPVFYVQDNGIGIREKHQQTLFRIFKRLHGRDKFGGGTGVGLTIAKKIVERHGGRIWIESVLGEGATFNFTLEKEP